jgi:protein-S-isoprenylcysteine O-methyltransferase Ste14
VTPATAHRAHHLVRDGNHSSATHPTYGANLLHIIATPTASKSAASSATG